jgi:hypothetical protein
MSAIQKTQYGIEGRSRKAWLVVLEARKVHLRAVQDGSSTEMTTPVLDSLRHRMVRKHAAEILLAIRLIQFRKRIQLEERCCDKST